MVERYLLIRAYYWTGCGFMRVAPHNVGFRCSFTVVSLSCASRLRGGRTFLSSTWIEQRDAHTVATREKSSTRLGISVAGGGATHSFAFHRSRWPPFPISGHVNRPNETFVSSRPRSLFLFSPFLVIGRAFLPSFLPSALR